MSDICIITPIYQTRLLDEEKYAIRHMIRYLSDYTRYIIAPDTLDISINGFETIYFPAHYFSGLAGYNQLLLSKEFYERFAQFDYMLIYQLDALVFSDRLQEFCHLGYDYIGSPWFASTQNPDEGFIGCGNGGLSLRHVQHCLDVIHSTTFDNMALLHKFSHIMTHPFGDISHNPLPTRIFKKLNIFRHSRHGLAEYIRTYKWNEDRFWGLRVPMMYPDFKISPPDVGLDFAFEMFPEYSLEKNGYKPPFGCHAWWRYGADFWKPYLIEDVNFTFYAHERSPK